MCCPGLLQVSRRPRSKDRCTDLHSDLNLVCLSAVKKKIKKIRVVRSFIAAHYAKLHGDTIWKTFSAILEKSAEVLPAFNLENSLVHQDLIFDFLNYAWSFDILYLYDIVLIGRNTNQVQILLIFLFNVGMLMTRSG